MAPLTTSQTQPRCPLLELPPELRLRIYGFLYTPTDCTIHLLARDGGVPYRSITLHQDDRDRTDYPVALLGTCKLINLEATPIAFSALRPKIQVGFRTYLTDLLTTKVTKPGSKPTPTPVELKLCTVLPRLLVVEKLEVSISEHPGRIGETAGVLRALARVLGSKVPGVEIRLLSVRCAWEEAAAMPVEARRVFEALVLLRSRTEVLVKIESSSDGEEVMPEEVLQGLLKGIGGKLRLPEDVAESE